MSAEEEMHEEEAGEPGKAQGTPGGKTRGPRGTALENTGHVGQEPRRG